VPWYYAVAERDHDLQNPTTQEKIRLLGERLRLGPDTRVLDVACGHGGPAVLLASTFGCPILGVERAPEFVEDARRRVAAAGLEELVEIVEGDAAAFPLEPDSFDVALCLGASAFLIGYFAWYAGDMVVTSYQINDVSQGLVAVPLWIPQSGMALGLSIMAIALVDDLVILLAGGTPSYIVAERNKKLAMSENI